MKCVVMLVLMCLLRNEPGPRSTEYLIGTSGKILISPYHELHLLFGLLEDGCLHSRQPFAIERTVLIV